MFWLSIKSALQGDIDIETHIIHQICTSHVIYIKGKSWTGIKNINME